MQYMEGKWRKADGKWKVITKPHCVQKDTVSCGVYVMKVTNLPRGGSRVSKEGGHLSEKQLKTKKTY